jgi:hypothetical protein
MITGFAVQLIFFPILGIEASLNQNWILTVIFTTVSFIRTYSTRRLFVWYKKKRKKPVQLKG